jgi:photosystem II stability/assembly factor-like uncharacterized protein
MKITLLIICFIISSNVYSGITPIAAVKAPLADQSLMLDITLVDDNKMIVVGEYGHILTSADGIHWKQMNVPVQATLTQVYFLNSYLGWAVGHDATILHTRDGGENWHIQQYLPATEKPLFGITFIDNNHGIAIGAYGLFYRTFDGGKNWKAEFHQEFLTDDDIDFLDELRIDDFETYTEQRKSILPHLNRIFKDGRTLYLVGEAGLIGKSNDLGQTWVKIKEVYTGSFFDIARTKKGTLLAVGLRGHIYRSSDNGNTWKTSITNTTALLSSIFLGNKHQIYIAGNNGVLLESLNNGRTFQPKIQLNGKSLIDGVWFKGKVVLVSEEGVKVVSVL